MFVLQINENYDDAAVTYIIDVLSAAAGNQLP